MSRQLCVAKGKKLVKPVRHQHGIPVTSFGCFPQGKGLIRAQLGPIGTRFEVTDQPGPTTELLNLKSSIKNGRFMTQKGFQESAQLTLEFHSNTQRLSFKG